jgi:hypothetical protein
VNKMFLAVDTGQFAPAGVELAVVVHARVLTAHDCPVAEASRQVVSAICVPFAIFVQSVGVTTKLLTNGVVPDCTVMPSPAASR